MNTAPVRLFINLRKSVTSVGMFFDSLHRPYQRTRIQLVQMTYLRCISSGNGLVFHSTARSSHFLTSASVSSLKTLAKAARYFPMSFSPSSESFRCSAEMRSLKMWAETDLAVHVFDDVGWPRVSTFDFSVLGSLAFPPA